MMEPLPKYLSMIYEELGDKENAVYFKSVHENVKEKINPLLWEKLARR